MLQSISMTVLSSRRALSYQNIGHGNQKPGASYHVENTMTEHYDTSPACWLFGLEAMMSVLDMEDAQYAVSLGSGELFCAQMNDGQKNTISFEVARCFHNNFGTPFFQDSVSRFQKKTCASGEIDNTRKLKHCTNLISEQAYLEYRINFKHFNDICAGLVNELVIRRKKYEETLQHERQESIQKSELLQFFMDMDIFRKSLIGEESENQMRGGKGIVALLRKLVPPTSVVLKLLWKYSRAVFLIMATYFFTKLSRHTRCSRNYILFVIVAETFLDYAMDLLSQANYIHREEQEFIVECMKEWDLALLVGIYVFGITYSIFRSFDKTSQSKSVIPIDHERHVLDGILASTPKFVTPIDHGQQVLDGVMTSTPNLLAHGRQGVMVGSPSPNRVLYDAQQMIGRIPCGSPSPNKMLRSNEMTCYENVNTYWSPCLSHVPTTSWRESNVWKSYKEDWEDEFFSANEFDTPKRKTHDTEQHEGTPRKKMKPNVAETNQSSHEETTEAKNENSPKRKGVDDENRHGSCKKMRHD